MRLLLLFIPIAIAADIAVLPEPEAIAPWFTGPLLANSATIIPVGHWATEPYFYSIANTDRYDNHWDTLELDTLWNIAAQPFFWVGLTDWADLQLAPYFAWNYREGPAHWVFGDFPVRVEFQLYLDQIPHKHWFPSVKLGIQESFPTGKYDELDPKKLFTDLGGTGAYFTTIQLAFGKLLHVSGRNWVQMRLNLDYGFAPPVKVKGLNAYGGASDTKGTVRPGQMFAFDFSAEYSFTRNFAFACDITGTYTTSGHFSGRKGTGTDLHGNPVRDSLRASIQYSLAPAFEYSWSQTLGVIAGAWFTLAGKNTPKFASGVVALNYYQ